MLSVCRMSFKFATLNSSWYCIWYLWPTFKLHHIRTHSTNPKKSQQMLTGIIFNMLRPCQQSSTFYFCSNFYNEYSNSYYPSTFFHWPLSLTHRSWLRSTSIISAWMLCIGFMEIFHTRYKYMSNCMNGLL